MIAIKANTKHLKLCPVTFRDACTFVEREHRHHAPPQGWKFGVGVQDVNGKLVGVAMIGRPVARYYDDGHTLEVTRCCTDGTKNACSMLYSAAARAARSLGYRRIITYTLESESGDSLRAAGWEFHHLTEGGNWNCPSRPRTDKAPICRKKMWQKCLIHTD